MQSSLFPFFAYTNCDKLMFHFVVFTFGLKTAVSNRQINNIIKLKTSFIRYKAATEHLATRKIRNTTIWQIKQQQKTRKIHQIETPAFTTKPQASLKTLKKKKPTHCTSHLT